ncbi:MAG: hypothetical protein HY512_01235 [Candidatus Aenigmarchaeota archaeon]|nr:hypothetical protein [Candidatus Aenigmarchaeota archaeon]
MKGKIGRYVEKAGEYLGSFNRVACLTAAVSLELFGYGCADRNPDVQNAPVNETSAETNTNKIDPWEITPEEKEIVARPFAQPLIRKKPMGEDLDTSKLPLYNMCKGKGEVIWLSDNFNYREIIILDGDGFVVYNVRKEPPQTYVNIPNLLEAEDADGDGNFELIARGKQTLNGLKAVQSETRMKSIRDKMDELKGMFEK